jgi:hypothetical protein
MTPVEEQLEKDIKFVLDATILNPESLEIIATTLNPPLNKEEINIMKICMYKAIINLLVQYPMNYRYIRLYASLLRKEIDKSINTDIGEVIFKNALASEVNRIFAPFHVSS